MHISTKEHIISVALLHHNLSLSSLRALYEALRARFAYFEIVLLNPTLESENNPPLESTLPSQATRSPSSRADEALFLSSRASVAIHTQNKDSSRGAMDCHATASAVSRNDNKKVDSREAQILNNSAQDSKSFAKNAKNLNDSHAEAKVDSSTEANLNEPAQDSRICDEKSGLCERVQERILGVCNRSTREAIADLSRKAESLQITPPPPLLTA